MTSEEHTQTSGEQFHGSIKIISQCPLCGTSYNPLAAGVLEATEGARLMYIQCTACSSNILALVITSMVGVSSIGLITDLTIDDIRKFQNSDGITSDDVLDIYEGVRSGALMQSLSTSEKRVMTSDALQ